MWVEVNVGVKLLCARRAF